MRGRAKGMWWGAAIEAPHPAALAAFYSRLLDWPVVHEEAGHGHCQAASGLPARRTDHFYRGKQ